MAEYNINQISKLIDRLIKAGINTEEKIAKMEIEEIEKIPNYTLKDVKDVIYLRKIIKANKNALFLFFGHDIKK